MRKLLFILLLFAVQYSLKAQYHLLYFSDDTISRLKYDAGSYYRQGKYDESIIAYKKLASIDSLKKYSIYKIGLNFIELKEPDSAKYYFFNAIKIGYDSIFIYEKMVLMYKTYLKDYEGAYNLLSEMIGYWPENPELYKERASLWTTWKKNSDGYIKDMQKAADLGDVQAKENLEYLRKATEAYKNKMKTK